jgi:hypothetical protein
VQCGRDSTAPISNSSIKAANMNTCMDKCNADSTCTGFGWRLDSTSGTPQDGDLAEIGYCYFRGATGISGDLTPYYDDPRDFAVKLASGVFTVPASTAASPAPTFIAPTTPWQPNANCASGSDPAGGRYTDRFGALWEVRCRNNLDVPSSEDTGQTSQGIFGCWKGCNNRPGCSSFVYDGNIDGMCRDYHDFAATNADILLSGPDHWNWQMSIQASSRCDRKLHSSQITQSNKLLRCCKANFGCNIKPGKS